MLELVKTFDLLASIQNFLQERRKSLGISDNASLHPRLVNQEKGGLIIYTWNDISEDAVTMGPVTHVGVYDPDSQKHKVLWIYNQKVKISSCTLNRERTLLGFTTVTRQDSGQDEKPKDLYQAFLAELQSLNPRVFSLNLQRHTYLKLQFLYPEINSRSSASSRHSHLIVMLHKESIGLYQINLARIGDQGIMMSGQPIKESVVRKFVWCQWDAQNQRLYYIHNIRKDNGHGDSVGHKLSVIQFHSNNSFDNMIDVPINFPFPYIRTSARSYYADIPLHPGIPDVVLNARVLSQTNGSMLLCYQEYISPHPQHTRTLTPSFTQVEEGHHDTVDVNYYVCMVHHAKTLYGCVSGLPRSFVTTKKLIFQWFGDYLMVTMTGVFCHLLNVSLDYEPCHHILLHNHDMWAALKVPASDSRKSHVTHKTTGESGKSVPTSASTDSSHPAQDSAVNVAGLQIHSRSLLPKSKERPSETSLQPIGEDKNRTRATADPPASDLIPAVTSQNLSLPSVPLHGMGSSMQGPTASSDVISVLHRDCLKLGQRLISCYGFSRETGVTDSDKHTYWQFQTSMTKSLKSKASSILDQSRYLSVLLKGVNMFDFQTGCIWRLVSNPEGLVKSFKRAFWSTQLAILHYLIMLRTRDLATIRQVMEALTEDPTSPEINIFLSEFLVASTYASMRKKSDKETTQLLTFTAADTFRGQFEKNSSGERLARITYISLGSVNISTKISSDRHRRSSMDSWDLLRRCLRFKQMPPPNRFHQENVLKALQKDIDQSSAPTLKKWTWVHEPLNESFFDGMHSVKMTDIPTLSTSESGPGSGRRSRTETILGRTPLFLQHHQFVRSQPKKQLPALTEQLLISHLMHHLKKDLRGKAQNIAREYITCQMQQCQQLCHLLWSIHIEDEATSFERLLPKLDEVGTDKEYRLFQVYERLFLVTQRLAFQRPPGFSSYFTSLGFKCLRFSLFLQYVDRGILHLTPDFVLQLFQDLTDDEENARIKFNIISRLPKPFAEDCFRHWHHPLTSYTTAKQQVAQVLQEGFMVTQHKPDKESDVTEYLGAGARSSSFSFGDTQSNTSVDLPSFRPLTAFIKHLENTAMDIQRQKPGSLLLMYDPVAIEEAALLHTRSHLNCDLSDTNF